MNAPEPLEGSHLLASFDCGTPELNQWLFQRARANQAADASRTYVVHEQRRVVGYYSLSSAALTVRAALGRLRINMPDPVPMALLGRLAVDRSWQGKGLGASLLRDALVRVCQAGSIIGVRGLLVHALNKEARIFYERHGFETIPDSPLTLYALLKDMRRSLGLPE